MDRNGYLYCNNHKHNNIFEYQTMLFDWDKRILNLLKLIDDHHLNSQLLSSNRKKKHFFSFES